MVFDSNDPRPLPHPKLGLLGKVQSGERHTPNDINCRQCVFNGLHVYIGVRCGAPVGGGERVHELGDGVGGGHGLAAAAGAGAGAARGRHGMPLRRFQQLFQRGQPRQDRERATEGLLRQDRDRGEAQGVQVLRARPHL